VANDVVANLESSRERSLPFLYKSYLKPSLRSRDVRAVNGLPSKPPRILAALELLYLLACIKICSNAGPDGKRRAFTMES